MEGPYQRHSGRLFGAPSMPQPFYRLAWPRVAISWQRAAPLCRAWIFVFVSLSAAAQATHVSQEFVRQPLAPLGSLPWRVQMLSSRLMAGSKSLSSRFGILESPTSASQGVSRARLSFLQAARDTRTHQEGGVEQTRFSTFYGLASRHYQDWQTGADSEGQVRLRALAENASRSGRRISDVLDALLNEALPADSVFTVVPSSDDPGGSVESLTLQRGKMLGNGGFHVIVAARPPSQGGRRLSVSGESRPPRPVETRESVAVRLPYVKTLRGSEPTEHWARKMVGDLEGTLGQASLFPDGVSHEGLVNTYGFAVPILTGRIGTKPALLSSAARVGLVNRVELVPFMLSDLSMLGRITDPNALLFAAKRLIQLLAHMEAAGIVHGDLKAANVLVNSAGQLFLGDFDRVSRSGQQIECGRLLAPGYSDPETAACIMRSPQRMIEVHPSMDAWSLGMLLFGLACEKSPFKGMSYFFPHSEQNLSVLASLWDPVQQMLPGYSTAVRRKPIVDWTGCGAIPVEVKGLVEGLLEPNRKTRLNPLDYFLSSRLFGRVGTPQTAAGSQTPSRP